MSFSNSPRSRRRTFGIILLALVGTSVAALWAWLRHISAAGYQGVVSDHFDGERFHNVEPTPDKSFLDLLRWRLNKREKFWGWRDIAPTIPPRHVNDLRVTLVNHATVLIQVDGINILTDPIWSERTSPVSWAGPPRYHVPGIRFEDLPPIDLVLVSHNHWDHLDLPTLQRLSQTHRPQILVPLGNREYLERYGIPGAIDVDWWQGVKVSPNVQAISVPVQHWSTRTRMDLRKTLWCGFVLTTPAGNLYFAGDTGLGSGQVFTLTAERFGPFRLALLPIGAFLPRWFMKDSHLSPADAIAAHSKLGAQTSIPIHFGCFDLGDDSRDEAAEKLREELSGLGNDAPRFWILAPGEGRDVQ